MPTTGAENRNAHRVPTPTADGPADQIVKPRDDGRGRGAAAGRGRLTGLAVLLAALVGVGGAVASGAFRDRTPVITRPTQHTSAAPAAKARPSTVPVGPAWVDTAALATTKGSLTFEAHAVITEAGTSSPDPANPADRLVTVPQMGGWYSLTNTSATARDVVEPVRFFAYWKVPQGSCARFAKVMLADFAANNIPIVQVRHGLELCPLAFGDSTLDTTPQTLEPQRPAFVNILATTMGILRQSYPMQLSQADAQTYTRATAAPPAGWLALDEELSPNSGHSVASTGLRIR